MNNTTRIIDTILDTIAWGENGEGHVPADAHVPPGRTDCYTTVELLAPNHPDEGEVHRRIAMLAHTVVMYYRLPDAPQDVENMIAARLRAAIKPPLPF